VSVDIFHPTPSGEALIVTPHMEVAPANAFTQRVIREQCDADLRGTRARFSHSLSFLALNPVDGRRPPEALR